MFLIKLCMRSSTYKNNAVWYFFRNQTCNNLIDSYTFLHYSKILDNTIRRNAFRSINDLLKTDYMTPNVTISQFNQNDLLKSILRRQGLTRGLFSGFPPPQFFCSELLTSEQITLLPSHYLTGNFLYVKFMR